MDRRRHPPVPTIREVVPGAGVNIVLKADQPTGRTVQGIIGDVLTRGNHPRGIKVRLTDGRVGRVQTMSSTTAAASSNPGQSSGSASLVEATQEPVIQQGHASGTTRPITGRRRDGGGDIRYSEHQELPPPQQIGLDAYVTVKKPKKRGRGKANAAQDDELPAGDSAPPEAATCPVCGEFEGDEAAVAHHVASHFDEATT